MDLCRFSSFTSTLQNLRCTFVSFPKIEPSDLRWKSHQNPLRVFFPRIETPYFTRRPARQNLLLACFANKPSIEKRRASRLTKSNGELRSELREFVSMMGFPEDHVPSLKELSDNGRKDLANIVRRRGYKVITELLRDLSEKGTSTEKHSHENQDISNSCKDEASDQERNLNEYAECVSFPSYSSLVESCIAIANGWTNNGTVQACKPSESSIGSLHLKAAKAGVLETIEDALDDENLKMSTDVELSSDILNSDGADTASVASQQISPCLMEQYPDRDHATSGELNKGDSDPGLPTEMAGERNNQIEIDFLRSMLNQKEMELSLLKQQIEKEKQALSILQTKVNAQISNAHRTISAKDAELHAAEESLSGLKEVQIEYSANGETIEVSGSFNGWHHRIRMDLHPSSDTINPPGSRISKLWSTILWLYPGIYEIKFIVNGQWMIDSQREVATTGNITNNVLRVNR